MSGTCGERGGRGERSAGSDKEGTEGEGAGQGVASGSALRRKDDERECERRGGGGQTEGVHPGLAAAHAVVVAFDPAIDRVAHAFVHGDRERIVAADKEVDLGKGVCGCVRRGRKQGLSWGGRWRARERSAVSALGRSRSAPAQEGAKGPGEGGGGEEGGAQSSRRASARRTRPRAGPSATRRA